MNNLLLLHNRVFSRDFAWWLLWQTRQKKILVFNYFSRNICSRNPSHNVRATDFYVCLNFVRVNIEYLSLPRRIPIWVNKITSFQCIGCWSKTRLNPKKNKKILLQNITTNYYDDEIFDFLYFKHNYRYVRVTSKNIVYVRNTSQVDP